MKTKIILIFLSIFFVLLSFVPTIYEINYSKNLPKNRTFELVHNYMFDYNFYLSRIREGTEGRWMVVEKYYNVPHPGSVFQIIYLYAGKIGGVFHLTPPVIYHLMRFILGLALILTVAFYVRKFFSGWWQIIAFLITVTAGSWPIMMKIGGAWRSGTYMGWWSASDSLQRITFLPHVLFGQLFMLIFIWHFSYQTSISLGPDVRQPHSHPQGDPGRGVPRLTPPMLNNIFKWLYLNNNFIARIKNFLNYACGSCHSRVPNFRFNSHAENVNNYPSSLTTHAQMKLNSGSLAHVIRNLITRNLLKLFGWSILGFATGIVFPPAIIIVVAFFGVLTALELLEIVEKKDKKIHLKKWFGELGLPRFIFSFIAMLALFYLNLLFKVLPWKALALFDVLHRMPLPYKEYALSLGPVLPLGIAGLVVAYIKAKREFFPPAAWIIAIGLLCVIFEKIPTQSPLRFTEAAIHIPLGILTTFLIHHFWQAVSGYSRRKRKTIRIFLSLITVGILVIGFWIMYSMIGWLTDSVKGKVLGTWEVPTGAELVYPLKDFMDAVYYLRDNTSKESVVLAYVTAGNYIPAYAGNFVFIGHANTPGEDKKEPVAAEFFAGKMKVDEAKSFLQENHISYIYFGPQEKEQGSVQNLGSVYPFITSVYGNGKVTIYKL
jgi:hypothetical protein